MKNENLALEDSEQRLSLLLQSLDEVVWFANMEGQMLYINDAAEKLYGRPVREFYDNSSIWLEVVAPEDRGAAEKSVADLVSNGHAEAEYRIIRPDGRLVWLHDRKYLVPHEPGASQVICGIASDVSARRELQQKEIQLEHVARLTTMGEMLAGIAHEINQPLSAISNYATACQNLLEDLQPENIEKLQDWATAISSQANRCGDIIRRLRGFAKQGEDQLESLKLDELIQESVDLILSDTRFQTTEITCDFKTNGALVSGNRTQLQQVFVNLLRNACEAVSNGEQSKRLIEVCSMVSENKVEVTVTDNGQGIDAKVREFLFEPFVSSRKEGLGLGLVISRSIIEKHGGQIWVDSNFEHGTRFRLTVPLKS